MISETKRPVEIVTSEEGMDEIRAGNMVIVIDDEDRETKVTS